MKPTKKFNIGKAPETFKHDVIVDDHDGTQSVIKVEYIYRSRSAFAKFKDENDAESLSLDKLRLAALDKANEATENDDVAANTETWQMMNQRQNQFAVDYLLKIAKGWDLKEKFVREDLIEVYDQYPNVFGRIIEDYQLAIWAGALKN